MSEKPFVRVKVRGTGHQIDVHRTHYDPDKHELVKRVPGAWRPRRPKYRASFQRKTSAPVAVEGSALPIEAGTVEKEVEP